MRLLLDTHTFLWFVQDNLALSNTARRMMTEPDNELLLSVVSVWEVAIKVGLGKLTLTTDVVPFFQEEAVKNDITLLAVELRHLQPIEGMPLHHRDPFDRLLIAQSIVEAVPILSADAAFDAYTDLTRIW